MDERKLSLQSVNYLVIDEADRLLDMGFEKELTRIARSFSRKNEKQSVLCSATFPPGVQRLASDFLDPKYYFVSAGKVGSTHSGIKQQFEWINIYSGRYNNNNNNNRGDPKVDAVVRNVHKFWGSNPKKDQSSVIVFTNTKDGAELYGKALSNKLGNNKRNIRVIHGDKPQPERNRAIDDFRSGKVSLLVATDVAARGLDVTSIGLVLQADAPRDVDTYTHRIGRTGRAGRSGETVTLLDSKSGFGLTSGLVDLLADAGQGDYIPSWLQGMAYIHRVRSMEEDMKIQAGSFGGQNVADSEGITNDEFSQQDFRRTAAKDSYGQGKDTAYRNFEEEAYASDLEGIANISISELEQDDDTEMTSSDSSISDFSDEDDDIDTVIDAAVTSFERKQPSQQLLNAVGQDPIGDTPDKSVLNSLSKGGQQLRFEYLGLFPFEMVSPLLMSSKSNNAHSDKMKILMVAEKPSIAKAIADALSGPRGPSQRRGVSRALPVYEFTTDRFMPIKGENDNKQCLVRVTSVVGHIYSLGFDFGAQGKDKKNDPRDYFHLPVTKQEESTSSKLRVVDHLRALAGDSEHLVLWLDCDPVSADLAYSLYVFIRCF